MQRFVTLDKKVGQTPLAAIQEWQKQHPAYATVPASYAGRLDPMASGKLLVLLGDACKRQRAYTKLDKEYEIEVLLDIGSDTGDALGLPSYTKKNTSVTKKALRQLLKEEQGAHLRAYPAFSSKTVSGKPLFLYSLEGTIDTIEIPKHIEHIHRIALLECSTLSGATLAERISAFLDLVPRTTEPSKRLGDDFRIDRIRPQWESIGTKTKGRDFTLLRLRVTAASGTYMRSLAGRIGKALGTEALALSIHRTKIGKYIPLWREYGCWLRRY